MEFFADYLILSIAAVILNAVLSVGCFIASTMIGVNYLLAFVLFLAVFIPAANYLVRTLLRVDVLNTYFS